MAKSQQKYKVESRSLTRLLNLPPEMLSKKLKELPLAKVNQVMSALNPEDYKFQYGQLSPSQKQYVDLNVGTPAPREAGVFRGKPEHFEKIPTLTPQQSKAAYALLQSVVPEAFLPENATEQQRAVAQMQGLPGYIKQLSQPSPFESQLTSMFGHLQNPILQGLIAPQIGNQPKVLYPSELAQQGSGLAPLLAQLAIPAVQAGVNQLPGAYEWAQENVPQYYQQAKESRPGQFLQQLPGNVMNLLSSLGRK